VNYVASDQKDYHKTPKSNLENSELDCKEIHDMNHNEKTIPDTKYPNIDTSALSHVSIEIVKTPFGKFLCNLVHCSPNWTLAFYDSPSGHLHHNSRDKSRFGSAL
jgi:hypothetical protein